MPRVSCADSPGCPPFRAICGDALGFIKVIEAQAEKPVPQVVTRWGEPSSQNGITCMSFVENSSCGLAVARNTGLVDIIDPGTGVIHSQFYPMMTSSNMLCEASLAHKVEDNSAICGVHLFREVSPRSQVVLTCTQNGNVGLRSIEVERDDMSCTQARWMVCNVGEVLCSSVDSHERYAVFGGKSVELSLWDIENQSKFWGAKSPKRDSIGMFLKTWITAVSFVSNDDNRKVVVGSGHHQLHLYDISAQRRPVLSFEFGESPIKAIAKDPNGNTFYVGNGTGNLVSFDLRVGKMSGGFKGKCAGSVRSISRHPELPLLASCGLDRYLRIHNTTTRQLLALVFLKQQLASVTFDINDYSQFLVSAKEGSDQACHGDVIECLKSNEDCKKSKAKRKRSKDKRLGKHEPSLKISKKKIQHSS